MVSTCPLLQRIAEGRPRGNTILPPHFHLAWPVASDRLTEGCESPTPCFWVGQALWCSAHAELPAGAGGGSFSWDDISAQPLPLLLPAVLIPQQVLRRAPPRSVTCSRFSISGSASIESKQWSILRMRKTCLEVLLDLSLSEMTVHSTGAYWLRASSELGTPPGLGDTAADMAKSVIPSTCILAGGKEMRKQMMDDEIKSGRFCSENKTCQLVNVTNFLSYNFPKTWTF